MRSPLALRADVQTVVVAPILLLAFALIPLQWVMIGGSLKVSAIGFLLIAGLLGLRLASKRRQDVSFTGSWAMGGAVLLFACYLALSMIALAYSRDLSTGLFNILREVVYISLAMLIGASLRDVPLDRLLKTLSIGLFVSLISFCGVAFYQLYSRHINPIHAYIVALAGGNPNAVQYTIFYKLFNESSSDDFSSAARHSISYLFVIGAMASLVVARRPGVSRAEARRSNFMGACCSAVVVASLSRQAILPLVIFLGLMAVRWRLWAKIGASVIAAVGGYFVLHSAAEVALQAKFVGDVVNNPRVGQYREALVAISYSPWLGWGTGTLVDADFFPHNLILNAWQQAGLLAALTTVAVVALLSAVAARSLLGYLERGGSAHYRSAIVLGLLLLTMVRMMVGVRGSLEPSSASALGLALAIVAPRLGGRPAPGAAT